MASPAKVPTTKRPRQAPAKPRQKVASAPLSGPDRAAYDDALFLLDRVIAVTGREHDAIVDTLRYVPINDALRHPLTHALMALFHAREHVKQARAQIVEEAAR